MNEKKRFRSSNIIIALVFVLVSLSGCSDNDNLSSNVKTPSNSYTPSQSDVVDHHGQITNLDRFKQFVENVHEGNKDKIRVVRYTIEGDPILQDLKYNGENIKVATDTTRDQYGGGNIRTTTCKGITKNKTKNGIEYRLYGCENSSSNIILVIRK